MPMKASRISLTFSISVAVLSSSISIEALLPNRTKKMYKSTKLDVIKNLEEKVGQRHLLYYVCLIRACNKVLYQLVYIGKKFVFLGI